MFYTARIENFAFSDLVLYSRPLTLIGSKPTITYCPNDITYGTTPNDCHANPTWIEPTALDAAGAPVNYSFRNISPGSILSKGTTTIKYIFGTLPDTAVCNFKITIEDQQKPNIIWCPSDTSVSSALGICEERVAFNLPIFSDNCGMVSITSNYSPGDTFLVGTLYTITHIATDSAGNKDSCSFTLEVLDTQTPAFTYCPNDTTVYSDPLNCTAQVSWTAATAIDNCGLSHLPSSDYTSGSFFNVGETVVTYSVTDVYDNSNTCSFKITVLDTIKPTITCPSNQTISTNSGLCGANISWTTPTALDNCQIQSISSSHSSNSFFSLGSTIITYTTSDNIWKYKYL